MKSIRIFLLKGKESMIDHVKSIQTLGCAYWKKARNKNLQVGDICYPVSYTHLDVYKRQGKNQPLGCIDAAIQGVVVRIAIPSKLPAFRL